MKATNAVEVIDLTRYYGSLPAVDCVSFRVRRGEMFGFLGPNGAGKTTTIRMLTTLLEPTSGTIRIDGLDVAGHPVEVRTHLGVVPEASNVYTELSATENLHFSGQLYRMDRARRRRRASELLDRFGLASRAHVKVAELSKGMRRRLTVAMALMHEPTLLFLDEPISGLDVESARALKEMVRELNERGATIFLTTHQIEVANELCQRVAIIHKGRIATVGTPETLKSSIDSVQAVEVVFAGERVGDISLAGLSHVTGEVVTGNRFRLFTDSPGEVIPQVVDFARRSRLRLGSLNTLGPSLEDVFVRITGGELGKGSDAARGSADPEGKRRRQA